MLLLKKLILYARIQIDKLDVLVYGIPTLPSLAKYVKFPTKPLITFPPVHDSSLNRTTPPLFTVLIKNCNHGQHSLSLSLRGESNCQIPGCDAKAVPAHSRKQEGRIFTADRCPFIADDHR